MQFSRRMQEWGLKLCFNFLSVPLRCQKGTGRFWKRKSHNQLNFFFLKLFCMCLGVKVQNSVKVLKAKSQQKALFAGCGQVPGPYLLFVPLRLQTTLAGSWLSFQSWLLLARLPSGAPFSDFLPPSYKGPCDYIENTHIIQDSVPIL